MRLAELPAALRPRRRYSIFCGTNTWSEWRDAVRRYPPVGSEREQEEVTSYEAAFARTVGTSYAFGFAAGRMGLYAILEALGVGPGDEVVIPAFTCVVVPNAILYRGARPVYVDVDPHTFNVDPEQVERAITPHTRALYAQHTFGLVCDVRALMAIGKRHGLPVIEDVSHALGALHAGRPAGSLADVAFFSTDYSKVINTQLGGMVTTDDPDLARRLQEIQERAACLPPPLVRRMVRSFIIQYPLFHPRVFWLGRLIIGGLWRAGLLFAFTDELDLQRPTRYPYPARLSGFQARLGLSQLRRLPDNMMHRRRIGLALEGRIRWLGEALEPDGGNHAFLRYSFLVTDRGAFLDRFARHFDLGIWFTSIAQGRDRDLDQIGYAVGSCRHAEHATRHIVNFPTHNRVDAAFLISAVDRELEFLR
ncbi:MAG TPA: DegT/DnrJ/EryC1/StrS aminotransferase family protein, partial [Candidatus Methylomirabilis sp.]|nr:DegT/DnrJ/EryC1/StrS aminotransferase family protein [Candidatus Methylomirabilis sp.]